MGGRNHFQSGVVYGIVLPTLIPIPAGPLQQRIWWKAWPNWMPSKPLGCEIQIISAWPRLNRSSTGRDYMGLIYIFFFSWGLASINHRLQETMALPSNKRPLVQQMYAQYCGKQVDKRHGWKGHQLCLSHTKSGAPMTRAIASRFAAAFPIKNFCKTNIT